MARLSNLEYKLTRGVRNDFVEAIDRDIVKTERNSDVDSFIIHEVESRVYFNAMTTIKMNLVNVIKETL